MTHIISYPFKPVTNNRQMLHIISISERMVRGGDALKRPHRTDFYIIHLTNKGSSRHMVDFLEIEVNRGDILVITPGQVHNFIESEMYDGFLLAFPKEFLYQSPQDIHFLDNAQIFNDINTVTKISFNESWLEIIIELIERMKLELATPYDDFQAPVLHNYLSNLLLFTERRCIEINNKCAKYDYLSQNRIYVTEYKKLIREAFRKETKVKYYANKLFISERKLQIASMAVLGRSPKELINEQIILETKRLLIHASMSVKEVGYNLGFEEPTNFTKFFKSQTGVSPTQFKEDRLLQSS
ncbi:helix-turn-helix domain-containing protein [Pedobacter sp. PAMC26386]|nr:helix-turn-helix domain-containing protein [Pedobacter sp. PAMC26386]